MRVTHLYMDKHIMSWIKKIDVHLVPSTINPATATTADPSEGPSAALT